MEDITLMRRIVGPELGVKASGGVRSKADVEAMVRAGAARVGASSSVTIVTGGTASEDIGSAHESGGLDRSAGETLTDDEMRWWIRVHGGGRP